MKKSFISLGLIVAATFALTNCAKELENPSQQPESAGIPFEITASTPDTKTANDDLATNWVANDALSVFHVETGATEFVDNDEFTITSENLAANKFTGDLTFAPEAGKSYDWYVMYPYNANYGESKLAEGKIGYTNFGSTCQNGEVSTGQSQDGNNSKSHLAGEKFPLYGVAKNVASQSSVSVKLSHLMSVIEVEVMNSTTEPITVTNITFTAPDYIVGSFYYDTVNGDYETSNANGSYNSKTAELNVKNAEAITVGASARFYIGIIPITVNSGEISMTVVTDKGTQTKTKSNANISFAAGVIKKIGFTYNQAVEVKTVSLPWTEDFGSEDLTNYTIVSGGSTTELYDASLAGGTAPEIMISKGDGSLQANVDLGGLYGNFTLSYKTNYSNRITVEVEGAGTIVGNQIVDGKLVKQKLTVPESLDIITVKFKNTKSDNTRLDDISLVSGWVEPQELSFAKNSYNILKGSSEESSFKGQSVSGAKTTVTYTSSDPSVATVDPSTGIVTLVAVGETTITATATATAEYESGSASYVITYTDRDYVILPWNYAGGTKEDLLSQVGVSAKGLGSDYAEVNAPYRVKLDTNGDYVVIKTNEAVGVISFGVKMIGGANTSYITVKGSIDGSSYVDIQTFTIEGEQNDIRSFTTTTSVPSNYRYVQLFFTKGSNVGLGPISILKPE